MHVLKSSSAVLVIAMMYVSSMQLRGLTDQPELNGRTVVRDDEQQIVIQEDLLFIPVRTINGTSYLVDLRNINDVTHHILMECVDLITLKICDENRQIAIARADDRSESKEKFIQNLESLARLVRSILPSVDISQQDRCVHALYEIEATLAGWVGGDRSRVNSIITPDMIQIH